MLSAHILIIISIGGYLPSSSSGYHAVRVPIIVMQEFADKKACELAATVIVANLGREAPRMTCVPKQSKDSAQ